MRLRWLIVLFFSLHLLYGQSEPLAQQYFERGEFDKALVTYEGLLEKNPHQFNIFIRVVECLQQLEQYDRGEKLLKERLAKYKQPNLLVELGYHFQLQKKQDQADKYYKEALDFVAEKPVNVYGIAGAFEKRALPERALEAYQIAQSKETSNTSFNFQMAQLYGQIGQLDQMIERYMTEVAERPQTLAVIQNMLVRYMNEDTGSSFSSLLRKSLLQRAQKSQDGLWLEFLTWFYVQQGDYSKAFAQQRALFRRNPDAFYNIVNLAEMSIENENDEVAEEILQFILGNTQNTELLMLAHYHLQRMQIDRAKASDYQKLKAEQELTLKKFGISPYSFDLQMQHAHFLTFQLNQPQATRELLDKTKALPINAYQKAEAELLLADIMLFEEKFNQALLIYTRLSDDVKNHTLAHEATLKAAQTSYFKGDFDWALTQLGVLKSADTQLIANDALDLYLIINDQKHADSALVALGKFAKADYLLYQNRTRQAYMQLAELLKDHKGEEIEDLVLFRLGTTAEKLGEWEAALGFYQQILEQHPESIYKDEALFFSGNLFWKKLNQPQKAQEFYEKIVLQHPDSIHFTEARKRYRQIRGDETL